MHPHLSALQQLSTREEIEKFISGLSVEDTTELFYIVGEAPDAYLEKIPAMIKGSSLFGLIAMITAEERVLDNLLKKYLHEEFFQHQLLIALEEFQKAVSSLQTEGESLYNRALQSPDLNLQEFEETIKILLQHCKTMTETENSFLRFIWQTERPDLIDRGSNLKEELLRVKEGIEKLPKLLAEAKNAQFSAPDESSPLEALPDLGITYPDQLLQLAKELGLNTADLLLEKLQKNGFKSVKSFKEKHIYSKSLLVHYLKK
ncbi:MAG: hypothetical protein ACK5MA_00725 [Parachlamydiaceae bacterium]